MGSWSTKQKRQGHFTAIPFVLVGTVCQFDELFPHVRVLPHEKTTEMAILMIGYTIITTIMYLVNKDPTFHETAYGFLVFVMLGYDLRLNTH